MTNNQLTDERIEKIAVWLATESHSLNLEMLTCLRELQERRLADKNCFMYGIVNPDGMAYMDEFCVSSDAGLLETEVATLNSNEGTDGYRVVALHTALPLMDSEREELQERRKADSEPVAVVPEDVRQALSKMDDEIIAELDAEESACRAAMDSEPVIIVGDDSGDALSYRRLLQSFAPGTKLYRHAQPAPVVPEEIEPDHDNTYDYVDGWNACRAAMLQAGNSPVIPDGWKLVPIDATRSMIDAARRVEEDGYDAMHKAMLAAAPPQEVKGE